jgi:hypothetical protein
MARLTSRLGPVADYDTPAWIVTALGVGLGLIGIVYLLANPEPLSVWVLEGVLVVTSAAIMVYGGYWITTYSLDYADRWIVAGWALGGGAIAVALVAGYVLSERFSGGLVTEAGQLVLFGALGGSLVALLTAMSIERRYNVPDIAYLDEDWEGSGSAVSRQEPHEDPLEDPSASLVIGFLTELVTATVVMVAIAVTVGIVIAWGLLPLV